MTSLLRPQGEGESAGNGQDVHYRPLQASWVAGVVYLLATAILGMLAPGPLWPISESGLSRLHIFFWGLTLASPLMLMSMGWSYVLTPMEFVVKRFGRERFRLPLHELKDTTTVMGMTWLNFASRRVHVVTGPDQARQLFLHELESRARRVGGKAPPPVAVQTGEGSVRLAVLTLRFPEACVTCGAPPTGKTKIEASHWFGMPMIQGVKLEVPACAAHLRREQIVRGLTWMAILGLGIAISFVTSINSKTAVFWGVMLLGLILGAVLLHVAGLLHVRTWIGWQALGIRTSELSGDLRYVTIHSRSETLMRALLKLRR